MPVFVRPKGQRFELRVTHARLPRPFYFGFPSEVEARAYGSQLHALLERGIVPTELQELTERTHDPMLTAVVLDYRNAGRCTPSDDTLLAAMHDELVGVRVSKAGYGWAEAYVGVLKARGLAPGSIRKRVGALARVLDWHLRMTHGAAAPANALRLLPKGYSQHAGAQDVRRDRRLLPGELERILAALDGHRRVDRERPWGADPAMRMLLLLIVDTGLRLREAYRLRVDHVDLARGVLRVDGSKVARGQAKPRVVPIKPGLAKLLEAWLPGRAGLVLLFPFWAGDVEDLNACTRRLSARFGTLFDYAGCEGLTEHDLRHEATCRWIELRRADGAWMFSEVEVARIMGWTSTSMLLRYASLRGEDLAARLRE